MVLRWLAIEGLRNIVMLRFAELARVNIIHGRNGSGKTSILEGIHLLGMGKSFRSTRITPLINYQARHCALKSELQTEDGRITELRFERGRSGAATIDILGTRVRSSAELGALLPLQLLNTEAIGLLGSGASVQRRRFLDWGVFHVEHSFLQTWREMLQILRQRNQLLRSGAINREDMQAWNKVFVRLSDAIDTQRQAYLEDFLPYAKRLLVRFLPRIDLQLQYRRGWDADSSLEEVLEKNQQRDQRLGYTTQGPQAADLRFSAEGQDASKILSRGQQKLLVCALRLAQGIWFRERRQRLCVFLVDDLAAELDEEHRKLVCVALNELGAQLFINVMARGDLDESSFPAPERRMFHVEHGSLRECA